MSGYEYQRDTGVAHSLPASSPAGPEREAVEALLTRALYETETTGGWWGHPECEEFGRLVAPKVAAYVAAAVEAARREGAETALRPVLALANEWEESWREKGSRFSGVFAADALRAAAEADHTDQGGDS